MKNRLLAALRTMPDFGSLCWAAVYPIAACLSLNLVLSQTSQGAEIIAAVKVANATPILVTLAALLYGAFACRAAVLLVGRAVPTADPRLGNILGAWTFVWVLASAHAALIRSPFSATGILLAVVGTLILLPFLVAMARPAAAAPPRTRSRGTVLLLILGLVVLMAVMIDPVSTGRALGPWALVNVAFGFWPLCATAVFVVAPRRIGLPAMTLMPLLLLVAFRNLNDNHELRVTQSFEHPVGEVHNDSETAFRRQVREWLVARCRNYTTELRPCPVFFVAAEGGGIRAAHWTALVLDHLDTSTKGRFYDHLFAISGVSGGSVGAAAYVAARVEQGQKPMASALDRYFGDDYLSPLLASFLFTDFLQRFLPFPIRSFDRAAAFEQGLEESWSTHFGSTRFRDPFLQLWNSDAGRKAPALFLNATNVETGKRFIVSNLTLPPQWRNDSYFAFDATSLYAIRSMPMSAAVHVSARFPFVSPPGVLMSRVSDKASNTYPPLQTPPDHVVWGRLVDGGYFEASGAATLNDLMDAFAAEVDDMHRAAELPVYIRPEMIAILVSNEPQPRQFATGTSDAPPPPARPLEPPEDVLVRYIGWGGGAERALKETSIWATKPPGSEFLSPITTLFATRDARATREKRALALRVAQMSKTGQLDCVAKVFDIPATIEGLQLLVAKSLMADVTGDNERIRRCTPLPGYEDISLGRYLNESLVEQDLFGETGGSDPSSPGLGWYLSARSRQTMLKLARNVDRDMLFGGRESGNIVDVALSRYYNPETVSQRMEDLDRSIDKILKDADKPIVTKKCEELTAEDDLTAILYLAIVEGDERLVGCTLKKGANPNFVTLFGETLLYVAAANDRLASVSSLLRRGADPNARSTWNQIVPLHKAAEGNAKMVGLLIAKGADVNAQTDSGISPLMVAAQSCNADTARLLLAAGADASRKDDQGRSALTFTQASLMRPECDSVRDLLHDAER